MTIRGLFRATNPLAIRDESSARGHALPCRYALALSLVVCLVATMLSHRELLIRGLYASDFEWPLRAGRAVL